MDTSIEQLVATFWWLTEGIKGTLILLVLTIFANYLRYSTIHQPSSDNTLNEALNFGLIQLTSWVTTGLAWATGIVFCVFLLRAFFRKSLR